MTFHHVFLIKVLCSFLCKFLRAQTLTVYLMSYWMLNCYKKCFHNVGYPKMPG